MLNALKGSDYDYLHTHLIAQFQNARTAPSQKSVYNTIAFAGYKHKQKTNEQAHITKFQKDPVFKNKDRCTNPNVGGQEVIQLRTAGSKVAPQLTRLPSGGERSRPRGHPRYGSLPKQTFPRKPRDPVRL